MSGEASRPEDEETEEKEDEMLNDEVWEYGETNEGGKLYRLPTSISNHSCVILCIIKD